MTAIATALRAPFPWFGGKSRVADLVWDRLGNVPNYVEPFAGSLAVLLGRPHEPKTETVNDADCYLANFWRALQADPEAVARWADWPVNEADLHARHWWLVQQSEFRERMRAEPEYFDARIAGWWCWGQCLWIGSGWCEVREGKPSQQLPHLGNAGTGVNRPSQQLPHLGDAGKGVNRPSQQLPHLGDAGKGLVEYLGMLAARLRRVRVACGDWTRVTGDSVTFKHGLTAVLLDPPYDAGNHHPYAVEPVDTAAVRAWALEAGENPLMRVALCGYEGEHGMPDSWECVAWKAKGGYGSQGENAARLNAGRERVWFSPHCLKPQRGLFG